jgi:small GTP-binding protein
MSDYDHVIKVALFGEPNVGKLTLCSNFSDNFGSELYPGIHVWIKTLIVDDLRVRLSIHQFDMNREYPSFFLLPTYLRGTLGGIFMYDITNNSSLAFIDDWLAIMRKHKKEGYPIIFIGNKADLVDNREVSIEEGTRIAKSKGIDEFFECSGKTGENVKYIFLKLIKLLWENESNLTLKILLTMTPDEYLNNFTNNLRILERSKLIISKKKNMNLERIQKIEQDIIFFKDTIQNIQNDPQYIEHLKDEFRQMNLFSKEFTEKSTKYVQKLNRIQI